VNAILYQQQQQRQQQKQQRRTVENIRGRSYTMISAPAQE